jgi:integrase
MPGLRQKGGIGQIEKRCKYAQGGWLRESTGTASCAEAEKILIRRLAEIEEEAKRKAEGIYSFEEAAMRYLEDIAHKPSADDAAMHLDQLLPTIGPLPLEQVHDGTLKPFVEAETARGLAPKSINNAIAVVSAVLNRAARVWRTDEGTPWLRQAPPRLSRLSTKGKAGRPYPLSWAEQDRLFRLLPRHLVDAGLFAVNTGCREQEICQLRWEWEVDIPELETSVFILPESMTKIRTERVVVLNSIARRVIDSRRGIHKDYVFTYQGKLVGKLRSSAWRKAWEKAGLPMEPDIRKGMHNLRHTFGRRLRSADITRDQQGTLWSCKC